MADGVQNIEYATFIVKDDFKQRVMPRHHRGAYAFIIAEQQRRARLRRFRGAHVRQHALVIQHALHQHLDLAAAGFAPVNTGRNNAGVVKYQQIAGIQLIKHIGEHAVA